MNRIVLRPEAQDDLKAITLYVRINGGEHAADQLVDRLLARCRIVAAHPEAGRPRPELHAGLRSLTERPYVILYRVLDDVTEIVAFVHGARDLPNAIGERL